MWLTRAIAFKVDKRQCLVYARCQRVPGQPLLFQTIPDILSNRQMWKNGVGLEHHIGWPQVWRHIAHILAANMNLAGTGHLETRNHPQQGCLATPRWPKKREEFTFANIH